MLPVIPPVVNQVTNSELKDLFNAYRQTQFTGAVDIAFAPGEALQLSLGYGNVIEARIYRNGASEPISEAILTQFLVRIPAAEVRATSLLPHMIASTRIMAGFEPVTRLQTRSNEVAGFLSEWGRVASPSLVHIRWNDAEALLTLPGEGLPPDEATFILSHSIRTAPEVMDLINGWDPPDCAVSRWLCNEQSDLWDILQIRMAFVAYVQHMLKRYELFTGRALVNMAARDVTALSVRNSWNIHMTGIHMSDNAIFATAGAAFATYHAILTTIMQHIISVVGRKLMDTILIESAFDLAVAQRNVLAKFELLPDPVRPHIQREESLNA